MLVINCWAKIMLIVKYIFLLVLLGDGNEAKDSYNLYYQLVADDQS